MKLWARPPVAREKICLLAHQKYNSRGDHRKAVEPCVIDNLRLRRDDSLERKQEKNKLEMGKWSQTELDSSRHSISSLWTSWVIVRLLPNVSFSSILPDSRSGGVLRPVFPSSILDDSSLMGIPWSLAALISSIARLLSIMYASMHDATATWRKKIRNKSPVKRTRFPANWRVLSNSRLLSSLQDVASSVNSFEGSDHHRFANLWYQSGGTKKQICLSQRALCKHEVFYDTGFLLGNA